MTRRSTLYAVRISPLSWQNPLAIEKGMTDLEHSLEALSSTTAESIKVQRYKN